MFLITTDWEETWRDNGQAVFLGEWCRRYSRKDRWSKMNAQMVPYHWNDRDQLHKDHQYLLEFQEKLLTSLTTQLNKIHSVNYSVRYWRILIGPWLGYFVPMMLDRWMSVQNALKRFKITSTIVMDGLDKFMVPNDMNHFKSMTLSSVWNHYVYSIILWQSKHSICKKKYIFNKKPFFLKNDTDSWKRKLARCVMLILNFFHSNSKVFFLKTYMTPWDLIRLQIKVGQFPRWWRSNFVKFSEVNEKKRDWKVEVKSASEFEQFVLEFLPKQLPTAYLEGYQQLTEQVVKMPWPKKPEVIFTSNAHFSDDVFKAWAGEKTEHGSKLVIGQHGGHYGTGRWSFPEEHELAISDVYLSWGWTDSNSKIKPVGQLKNQNPKTFARNNKSKALMVTATLPRQSYFMYSAVMAGQWLDYFEDQCSFVQHLPDSIRDALIVRMYSLDYGWDQMQRWQDRFPQLHLDSGASNLENLMNQSRIYIATYNATTFLESISINMPTIMYWNPKHWELRDSAIPYFEELELVGIFHKTPEAAANHLAKIWNNIDKWWRSPNVQQTVEHFKTQYCSLPADRLDKIKNIVKL
jgi:putative transferase (TIGR04331 family)